MVRGWHLVALHDIADILLSGVDKHIVPGEPPVGLCNYLDVYRNRQIRRSFDFAQGTATAGEIGRLHLQKGDVLITKDSETPDDIGVPAVIVDELPNTVCGYHLALIRPSCRINSAFLCWFLQSEVAKRHFLRYATGVTRFGLNYRAIASLPVQVPHKDEQATIARTLDAVDTAIERTREAVEGARGLKNAIIQRFFFRALGETAYADRPTKRLPRGWALVPTETLLESEPKNGVSPKAATQPPGIPTFSIAAIRHGKVDLESTEHLKYARLPEKVAQAFRVNPRDILIVRGNANPDLVGKAGMIDRFPDGCIYPDITKRVVFRQKGERTVSPQFAVLAWNHAIVHNQVLRRAKTSNGTLKINNRDVRQIILPVPPPDEQAEIVNLAEALDHKTDSLAAVADAYQQLKWSLMHDLLTGKVRVKGLQLDGSPPQGSRSQSFAPRL